jgi:predicted ATPase
MVVNGDASSGVKVLTEALKVLEAHHHHLVVPDTSRALAEGLVRCGQPEEALATVEDVLARMDQVGEIFWLPDLLRVRGEILLALPRPDIAAAEDSLLRSMDCARKQFALGWELRAAIPLARMWNECRRGSQARTMLEDIYRQFDEGFETKDMVAARGLLDDLANDPRVSER